MVQYRRSKKIGPLRFTASQRGISTSVGYGPLRVTRRADGRFQRTVRVPGTGISDTRVVGSNQRRAPASPSSTPDSPAFIIVQLGKLFLLLVVLGVIISVLAGNAAVGFGIVGVIFALVLVGGIASMIVLIRQRRS